MCPHPTPALAPSNARRRAPCLAHRLLPHSPWRRQPPGRTSAAVALSALLFAAATAQAAGRLVDVTVLDRDSGRMLPVHRHAGQLWVAGQPGARYAIVVHNRLGERVLAVTAVDGINAVSGETAGWEQTGYVLGPYRRYAINGWRKSDEQVAAFTFTALADAYATRTGRPSNVGVIGVAIFRERVEAPAPVPQGPAPEASPSRGSSAPDSPAQGSSMPESSTPASPPLPGPAAGSAEARDEAAAGAAGRIRRSEKLGTGHGGREWSAVTHTSFERARSTPDEVIMLRYDSRENLVAMGVLPAPFVPGPRPDAFPHSPALGYVPDPPTRPR